VSDVETAAGSLRVNVTHNNSALLPTVTVTPDGTGACTFTVPPKDNKVGTATFTVTVPDGDGGTDTDTFTLPVTAVNDLRVRRTTRFRSWRQAIATITCSATTTWIFSTGNGGDTLTLLSIGQTQHGHATIVNNELHYVPNANLSDTEEYTDTFTYTMRDASGAQSTATVVVTVMPVNDAPTISALPT
jgi:hypothetical protein